MNSWSLSDTIVASATPLSVGALAILRMSGSECFSIIEKSIKLSGGKAIKDIPFFFFKNALFIDCEDSEKIIDEVMIVLMKEPRSYTGENMVEITCHGNPLIVNIILQKLQKSGARMAFPGEFTQRAFLKGKKDLTQAEAVADVIHSRNEALLNRSLRVLSGELSEKVQIIINSLESLLLYLEAELDFFEEEIDFLSQEKYSQKLNDILCDIQNLCKDFHRSSVLRDGISVALVGPPNVGKSSILNALLRTNRSIVSDIPGTTTDTIDAEIVMAGHRLRFFDTAGMRKTHNMIEKEGVLKSFEFLSKADIIFFILSFDCFTNKEQELFEKIYREKKTDQKLYFIVNKKDCLTEKNKNKIEQSMKKTPFFYLSALDEKSVSLFEKKLEKELEQFFVLDSSSILLNQRQYFLFQKTINSLLEAKRLSLDGFQDVIVVCMKEALSLLNEIIGQTYDPDILNKIFSNFCIGK